MSLKFITAENWAQRGPFPCWPSMLWSQRDWGKWNNHSGLHYRMVHRHERNLCIESYCPCHYHQGRYITKSKLSWSARALCRFCVAGDHHTGQFLVPGKIQVCKGLDNLLIYFKSMCFFHRFCCVVFLLCCFCGGFLWVFFFPYFLSPCKNLITSLCLCNEQFSYIKYKTVYSESVGGRLSKEKEINTV